MFGTEYDISVHSIDGLQTHRIVRSEVEGPPLTAEERRERDDLRHGAMRGAVGWGVRQGAMDEDWLVFLRFRVVEG